MFFRSLFYERTVLRHLERVEQLPAEATWSSWPGLLATLF